MKMVTREELISILNTCEEKIDQLEKENARLREALELIAASKRSDGTYNRCREACEQLAKQALKGKEE